MAKHNFFGHIILAIALFAVSSYIFGAQGVWFTFADVTVGLLGTIATAQSGDFSSASTVSLSLFGTMVAVIINIALYYFAAIIVMFFLKFFFRKSKETVKETIQKNK